jgi:hypothetical protein
MFCQVSSPQAYKEAKRSMEKLSEGTRNKGPWARPVKRPAPDSVTDAILEEILKAAGLESVD